MLSLAIRIGKNIIDIIGRLLSTLRIRATYSENLAESRSIITKFTDYNILDKASILLTPTAYSNTRVHSVKTYTGDELVTNGGFDTNSDWDLLNGATITSGYANFPLSTSKISQPISPPTQNSTYRVEFNSIRTNTSSTAVIIYGNGFYGISDIPNVGKNILYITTNLLGGSQINTFQISAAINGTIDNISVVEVSSDFDFDRASSATRINSSGLVQDMQSITDVELVQNGDFEELGSELVTSTSSTDNWINARSNSVLSVVGDTVRATTGTDDTFGISTAFTTVIGKTYKINSFGARNNSSGSLIMRVSNTANLSPAIYQDVTTDDLTLTTSAYFVATATTTYIGFLVTIPVPTGEDYVETNLLSVQQVDPNDRWTLGTGWSIEDGKLVGDGAESNASQSGVVQNGNTYKITLTAYNITTGYISARIGSGGTENFQVNSNGTQTFYATADNGTFVLFRNQSGFDGSIDNISVKDITFSEDVDLARINYDSNGDNGHWLLEPTSTNLIPYSEDFSSGWAYFDSSTDANQLISPSGVLNASKFIEGTGSSIKRIINLTQSIVSGNNYTFSIFAKKGERDFITLTNNTGVADVTTTFDLTNGTIISGVGSIETFTNGWFRCTRSFTAAATVTSNFICQAFINAGSGISYQGDGTSGIYIWGAQLEELPYATSYIPTYGSTVTRATETLTGSGNSILINSTEGVLYAEIAALADDGGNRRISISDGSETNRLNLFYTETTNEIKANYRVSNSTVVTIDTTDFNITNFNKIAFRWQSGNFVLFINGENKGTNSNTTMISANTLNVLRFEDPNLVNEFYGKCKALAVFDEALTDDELELLTGITNYGSFNELAQANGYTII